MQKFRFTRSVSVLALALASGPALADITPQQAWDDLEAYFQGFGYSVAGTEAMSGDTLTVSDIILAMTLPEDGGEMTMSMPQLSFVDRGDGSVGVSFPETMPIRIAMAPEGEKIEMTLDYTHRNLDMVISGDPDDQRYDYSADEVGIRLADLVVDGQKIDASMARMSVTMTGLAGNSQSAGTDLRRIAQEMSADAVTYDFAFNDPDSDENGIFNGSMAGVGFEGTMAMPVPMDANDMQAALDAGFAVDGSFTTEASKFDMSVNEGAGTTVVQTAAQGGGLSVTMGAGGVAYSTYTRMLTLAMSGPEIPLPVNLSANEIAMNIGFPIEASDAPQDAALGITIAGLEMAEVLWNIFDPGAVLPRDPVTVAVELEGQATLMADLTNPDAMDQMPAMPNALTLKTLLIEAVGARVTGSGDVTFDPTDLQTFDGVPAPEGAVELEITGANALIDKLIEMGLMSAEDAMGGRMMMSMFTVPGEGEDQLRSRIEVTPDGQVLANGQRIK